MAIDTRYICVSDLEAYFVDKDTGLPLANGHLRFYKDSERTIPKEVFQLSGFPPDYSFTSLGAQVDLSAVGTPQNDGGDNIVIYYYPYDADGNVELYFVDVTDSNDVPNFTREAWPPGIDTQITPIIDNFPTQNQMANPQFTEVFINDGFTTTYSVASATNQIFSFAPDWDFIISGSGSVVVERIAVSGNEKVITSPPYVLDVSLSGGITACYLRQRFLYNSGLWSSTASSTVYLSGALVARNQNAGVTGIQMLYQQSIGSDPVVIIDESFDNSGYVQLNGVTADPIPLSSDTLVGKEGYVNVYLSFLPNSHVRISSAQVVPVPNPESGDFLQYDLNSSNREQALMGDYYLPALKRRPAPSILTGWDFKVNPFQATGIFFLITAAAYICDQTIATCGATGNVNFARNPVDGGLIFTALGSNDSFYILQYLTGQQAKAVLSTPLSSNIVAYKSPALANDVTMRVYLFRAGSTGAIPLLPDTIGTLATDGTFTLTESGWTEIPRSGLDTAKTILPPLATNEIDLDTKFNGWEIIDNDQINDTDKFAIVVTFHYIDTNTEILVDSISLTPGTVPCRPAPQTPDEALRECLYYYEKSYEIDVPPGTIAPAGARVFTQAHSGDGVLQAVYPRQWRENYLVPKRVPVIPSIYSPTTGALDNVEAIAYQGASAVLFGDAPISAWTQINNSTQCFTYEANARGVALISTAGASATLGGEAVITYHWVADARLGIVA